MRRRAAPGVYSSIKSQRTDTFRRPSPRHATPNRVKPHPAQPNPAMPDRASFYVWWFVSTIVVAGIAIAACKPTTPTHFYFVGFEIHPAPDTDEQEPHIGPEERALRLEYLPIGGRLPHAGDLAGPGERCLDHLGDDFPARQAWPSHLKPSSLIPAMID